MAVDACLVSLSYYLALTFRYAGSVPSAWWPEGLFFIFLALAVAVHIYFNWAARAYEIVNRYIGLKQALRIIKATSASALVLMIVVVALSGEEHLAPLSVIPAGWILTTIGMIGVRFYTRIFHERSLSNVRSDKNECDRPGDRPGAGTGDEGGRHHRRHPRTPRHAPL
jgi:FlaA1/EpsC-like NDP-sugar epimerase